MLWCCLHFPDLPLLVFARHYHGAEPAVCTDPRRHGLILAANRTASEQGIAPGMNVLAAHGLCPNLQVVWQDETRESAWLEGAGLWGMRFTPTVSLAPPAAVLLEVEGCLGYFGGTQVFFARLHAALAELGGHAVVASAPTAAAALMLARAGRAGHVTERAALGPCLDAMPLDWLDAPADSIAALHAMGMNTLGECRALPRAGLARRFGQRWLDALDRCYGDCSEVRPALSVPPRFRRRIELPATTDDVEALLFAARRLVLESCGWLQGHGSGAARLALTLHHERGAPSRIEAGMRATREASHIMIVLREHLARCALPAKVSELELEIAEHVALIAYNLELRIESGGEVRHSIDRLLDRLRARLGEQAVVGLAAHPDHRPETAWATCDPGEASDYLPPAGRPPRPLWLLPEPVALASPVGESIERVLQGPERIESGWWDGADVMRDYYVVRTPQGMRWWVFHVREKKRWFLQGMFG